MSPGIELGTSRTQGRTPTNCGTLAPIVLLVGFFFGRLKKIEAKIYAIPCEILNNRHFFRLPKVTFFFSNCLSVGKFLNINKGEELKLVDFMRKCEIHR